MIHVISDWYIDADPNCYIVGQLRKRKVKKGDIEEIEDYLSNTKFPTTVSHALEIVIDEIMRDKVAKGKIEDLVVYRQELIKLTNKITKKIGEVEKIK